MTTPEFLYFDLGRVLLTFDHAKMLRQMAAAAGVEPHVMREAIMPSGTPCEVDLQWQLEAGQVSDDDYFEQVCERIGKRPQREQLEQASNDIFGPIDASLELLDRLHEAGYRLGLLSNTCGMHWRWFLDGRYPTPGLQQSHVPEWKRAGVPAAKVFYTDDRQDNVAGAIACGIDAVQFSDTARLEYDLRARGIDC